MDLEPFPVPNSTYLKAGVAAAAGVLSHSCVMSHSLAWKDWEPVSLREDAVPWGGGNPPSLEDATPGPSVSIPGAVRYKTRRSAANTTHWLSLCFAIDCSTANRTSRGDYKRTWALLVPLASLPRSAPRSSGRGYVYKAAKLLLRAEDGSFAWEDTGVRLH